MGVTIIQSDINSALLNKLKPEDIKTASDFCKKGALRNQLNLSIMCKINCNDCVNRCTKGVVIPEGNVNADTMFICEQPTELDGKTNTVMFDAQGRVFTVILDKLGIKRDNVYITPVIKCSTKTDNELDLALICSSTYLLREIALVKPTKIIAMGTTAVNITRSLLGELDYVDDALQVRGQSFTGKLDGIQLEVMQTISPDFLLTKAGSLYNKYKLDIWNDINNFYKK